MSFSTTMRSQYFIYISFLWNPNLLHALHFLNFRIRVGLSILSFYLWTNFSLSYTSAFFLSKLLIILKWSICFVLWLNPYWKNATFLIKTDCCSSCYTHTISCSLAHPLTFFYHKFTDCSRKRSSRCSHLSTLGFQVLLIFLRGKTKITDGYRLCVVVVY